MVLALGIISAIAIGTLNGILIAEAMYGRYPANVVSDGLTRFADWMVQRR